MNIGSVKLTPSSELQGSVAFLGFDAKVMFVPVASANERAPKFEIVALNVARRWVRIGALWERDARESGEVYLTGHLDDPCLPSKLYVAAFRQDDGAYSIVWNRSNPQAAISGAPTVAAPGFDEVEGSATDFGADDTLPADAGGRARGRRRTPEPQGEVADDPFD
jgi:uncharacterized protein (DUF736 family)